MKLNIYQVDAFSRDSFSGNPAAIVPLNKWLADNVMQKIAEENNLSETAFFMPNDNGFDIRWFTPAVEVALCGHATLASAYVIFEELGFEKDIINFNCKSGPISVQRQKAFLTLDFPTDKLERVHDIPVGLYEGLGKKPLELWSGRDDILCVLESQADVKELTPDFSILKKLPGRGIIVTARGDNEYDFVSRGFFPQSGINEDPATGSAHTSLTPYWSRRIGKSTMKACQLSSRKGYFQVNDNGDRTLISGQARLYLKGEIYVDS